MTAFAELAVTTNFSFLRGGSHPEELVGEAARLGLAGIAVADRNTLAGVVRGHVAARTAGFRYAVGCRLVFRDGTPDILAWPTDRAAYGRLCRLLTLGNRRAAKGECHLDLADLLAWGEGLMLGVMPRSSATGSGPIHAGAAPTNRSSPRKRGPSDCEAGQAIVVLDPRFREDERRGDPETAAETDPLHTTLAALADAFPGNVRLMASRLYAAADHRRLAALDRIACRHRVPLMATNDVLYHAPERRRLQDVLTCIREHKSLATAGRLLAANAERHLKDAAEMARLFRDCPEAVAESRAVLERLAFSLDELRYQYPDEPTGDAPTPQEALERLTAEGARFRYPGGVPAKVQAAIDHELRLIGQLDYAPYFLTVHDIVRFARQRGILAQGRGSAANSAVCFVLGITEVDPERSDLLFERFISAERNEPPDIDVDFEHERREEVMQYIYDKYGRHRAGLAATVITYRTRSAVREVGKAFGLSEDTIGALSGTIWGWSSAGVREADIRRIGLDPVDRAMAQVMTLSQELIGFPRHLSQHVGGFVMTRDRLDEMVPVMNAAMEDRTTVEWDKDDLDALNMLKVDVLALGMLSCIRRAFDFMRDHYGEAPTLATIPAEDPAVYRMLQRADSLGVFQVESRAQMTMLPRLRPASFYDLVIEVAIVRPGPIQGDMVHPYLRRRQGLETVVYPSPSPAHGEADELEQVLGRTLGVPLFQEQAMKIAIVAAGFSPGEADRLRRAMATFKRVGTIKTFQDKMVEGMTARGYSRDFAERCFRQIEGFGEYGFPESHAASFALLVYASAWLKCHYPDVFCAALLNSQPMGFYAPAQIVRDAQRHGIETRPPDINFSDWDSTLESLVLAETGKTPSHPPPSRGRGHSVGEQDRRAGPPSTTESRPDQGTSHAHRVPPPERGRTGGGQTPKVTKSRFDRTPAKTERARRLRRDATSVERLLWSKLRSAQIEGASFRRQHPVGPYVLDFCCPSLGLVVEVDGDQHARPGRAAADRRRDAWLADRGLTVLRFWNAEVRENLTGVVEQIRLAVLAGKATASSEPASADPPLPSPDPAAEDPLPTSPFQGEGHLDEASVQSRVAKDAPRPQDEANPAHRVPPPERGRTGGGHPPPQRGSRLHPANAEQRPDIRSTHAVRLGLRQIKGFHEEDARALMKARGPLHPGRGSAAPRLFDSVRDLWLRSGLSQAAIERLADADAFRSVGLDRRDALWAARGLGGKTAATKPGSRLPLFDVADLGDIRKEPDVALPPMPVGEHVVNDYRYLSLSLKAHPLSFLRPQLAARRIVDNATLIAHATADERARKSSRGEEWRSHDREASRGEERSDREAENRRRVTVAGLVLVRQRPGTASGVIFMTIEDETDIANIIVWPKMFERFRPVVLGARLVAVTGRVQSESGVIHVVSEKLEDLTPMLSALSAEAGEPNRRDLEALARADEIRRPQVDMREKIGPKSRLVQLAREEPGVATDLVDLSAGKVMPKGRNFH
ncbi:MAG: error-prone DNA polymerase [Bauldia litoralis]|uniref:error-prone DNA polymerase n=2 Tax=Bauldia litoralis TaxID=665467 RepID=UPI003296B997